MANLLVAREYLKQFYSKYEIYLQPVGKFLLAFLALQMINSKLGYMASLNHASMVLIVALMCSFLPKACIILFSALFILLHLYTLAPECALAGFALFAVMFLLYFRFSPQDMLGAVLTPICFGLKIPYVIPVAFGLTGTPSSIVSTGCGVIVYYLVAYMADNATAISGMNADEIMTRFRYVVDGILGNRTMFLTVVAFAVTILVVYTVRRLPINQSWHIAILSGILVDVMVLLIGDLLVDANISIAAILLGSVAAALVGEVLLFFLFNVDYSRMERVQFEDDEYYYYVKAVPKVTIAKPSRNVKKINSQRKPRSSGSQHKKTDRD